MIILILTAIISFLGSVHPGPLNIAVVSTTLNNNLKSGIIVALGGIIPEFIYSGLAAEGVLFFQHNQLVFNLLRWLLVVILVILAALAFFEKEKTSKTKDFSAKLFFKGFILSILNPQLILYWLLVVVYYQNFDRLNIKTSSDKVFFMLGASLGAFLLNYLYARWSFAKKSYIFKSFNKKIINQIAGISFLVMALFQVYKILYS